MLHFAGPLRKGRAASHSGLMLHFAGPAEKGRVFTVYFEQENPTDRRVLRKLAGCFGLFTMDDMNLRGLHKNMLRLTYDRNQYLLVGSQSPYYNLKPPDLPAVRTDSGGG
ncbi:Hypp2963 [Branchiostoma lanceolatum]|uniref:Hypp2963 protein n=1 Tax=Branchiostoma lanceolatum TaxID=7740 RepID=A0A8J9ZVP4_BRALA|nr:Hypp2963 [Branchiostoma lanceolatum]